MQYQHQIDVLIENKIKEQRSLNATKIHQYLVKTYNPKISRTTVLKHLDDLMTENVLEKSNEIRRNNEVHYYLSGYAERQLEYYGRIEPIKSQREGRDRKRSKKELEDKHVEDEKAENERIIFLDLLIQASDGSGRFMPASRNLLPEEIDLPVFFMREKGVTVQDVIEHRDVGNGRIFRHVNFTMSMVQKCFDVLEKKYGIDIEKHTISYVNTFNTSQIDIIPAGSEPGDLVEKCRKEGCC